MNKTYIIIGIIAVVLVVVLIVVLMPSTPNSTDIADLSSILNDPKTAMKGCKSTCATLTKHYSILARIKPKRLCESDCANGKDITKLKY